MVHTFALPDDTVTVPVGVPVAAETVTVTFPVCSCPNVTEPAGRLTADAHDMELTVTPSPPASGESPEIGCADPQTPFHLLDDEPRLRPVVVLARGHAVSGRGTQELSAR